MANYADYLRDMQKAAQQSAKKEEAVARKTGKARQNSYEETVASVKKSLAPKVAVDDTFLQQLQADATSFFENGQKSIKDIGYSAGRRAYDSSASTIDDLRSRSNSLMSYILENREGMGDDNYRNTRAFIRNLQEGLDGYEKEYKGIQDHFSQWDTEDAYNTAVRQGQWADKYRGKSAAELSGIVDSLTDEEEKEWLKGYSESVDYQERLELDPDKLKAEIDAMAKEVATAQEDKRKYDSYIKNLSYAFTDPKEFRRVQDAVLAINQKYGSVKEMERALKEKREYLASSLQTQEQAQETKKHEEWLKTIRKPEEILPELEQAREAAKGINPFLFTGGDALNQRMQQKNQESAQLLADLEKEYFYSKQREYQALMQNPDFEEKSKYTPTKVFMNPMGLGQVEWTQADEYKYGVFGADLERAFVNKDRRAIDFQNRQDMNSGAAMWGGHIAQLQMTNEEVKIYNYLYATEGKEKASEYLNFLNSELNRRQREHEEKIVGNFASENLGTGILASGMSVLQAPLKGLSYLGQGMNMLVDGSIDQNAGYNRNAYLSSAIRDAVAQKIEQSGNWGKAGSFAYQTAMSMGDFLINATIAGGSPTLSMAIMGSGAAADTVISSKDRGLDDRQAFMLGTVAGIAEALTEKFSLEALLDPNLLTNGLAKYVVKNVIAEGSEEMASSVLNLMADLAVSGDRAQFRQSIHKYQQMGYTEGEAFGRAAADQAMSLGMDFLGGAISGGIMGSAYGGGQYLRNRRTGQAMAKMLPQGSDAMQNILDEGMNSPKDSDAYLVAAQMQKKIDQGKQLTDADRGRLFASNPTVASEQIREQGKVELATPTTRGIDNTSEEWQQAKRLSAITGRKIIFFNGGADVNGYFEKGNIYVNIDGADTVLQTVSHELTHSTEMAAAYKDLSRFVMGRIAAEGGNLEQIRKDKAALYERHGVTLKTQEEVDAEIVAQYVQEHLLTDEETIFQVAVESPTLGQKILNWIDGLLAKLGNHAAKERQVMTNAKAAYAKALDQTRTGQDQKQTAGQKESTTQNQAARTMQEQAADDDISDEEYDDLAAIEEEERIREEHAAEGNRQYSIETLPDGKKYVRADRQVIYGNDPEGWSEQVEDYINGKIRRGQNVQLIAEDGDVLTLTKDTAGKLADNHTGRGTTMDDELFYTKANAAVHIDELASVSHRGENRADKGSRHGSFAAQGWNYRTAFFRDFDGKYYRLKISVAKNADGNIVYNIGDIEERSFPTVYGSSAYGGALGGKTSFKKSVPQANDNVNRQYSISESADSQAVGNSHGDNRSGNENIVEDIVRDNARQAGYPVLKGEQIVPFKTWVKAEDRGNYGLVVGLAPDRKLVVNFRNKEENLNKTLYMPYDLLTPVPGEYQMTKEEYDSLMHSAPEKADSHPMTAEEQQEMEDLLNRAGGNTGKKGAEQVRKEPPKILDIARDQLPGKARDFLRRAESRMLNAIGDALSIPRYTRYNVLKEIIQGISEEYIRTGTVEQKKLDEFFDKAYSQGIVEDTRFFDQYKDIKEKLKTTAVTISQEDQKKVENFADFRKKAFGTLRILNEGGVPVTQMYEEMRKTAPELFPAQLKEPADQLVRMYGVAKSIQKTHKSLDDFHGEDAAFFRQIAKNDFQNAVDDAFGDLRQVRKYAEEKDSKPEVKKVLTTEEASKYYEQLNTARRDVERVRAKNLLSDGDEMLLGRMLKGEITEAQLNPDTDNVKGIMAVYRATLDYDALNEILREYKRSIRAKRLQKADDLLQTANTWKDKKSGFLYARETMRRNILDIVPNRDLAERIIETYFESVHRSEAESTKFKTEMRDRVRALALSTKVDKGNAVSEAHAVQLLGEAMDNIRFMEKSRGRKKQRDGMSYDDWVGVVQNLWAENPNLNRSKIENAVDAFRKIYDELFQRMNQVRVENGYEPVNYRQGYFPHFQPGNGDGIMAYFGKILGIDVNVDALPTTINGLSHTFKPGIQWFGNAQQRIGFNTAYDAVEGFDKYIEGVASVIFQTENIQNLRALATQARYRTSGKGIRDQVDAVRKDDRLSDEEKQAKITDIFENGKFALANFVVELDEYTNLLANKKSKYDRTVEGLINRKVYTLMKTWENQIGANMIAGNISSALTNFIPLTQAGAQLDTGMILKGMWSTLQGMKQDDGIPGMSDFLINRRGSDPLVKTWVQKASGVMGTPMELIDNFTSEAIVRAAYLQNLKRGMPEAEALHQADIFAAGVMADRSKGSMPTLFESRNPIFKAFTQFQLEVNNQVSEVFKDLPRNFRGAAPGEKKKALAALAAVLAKYFIGAMLYNEVYEALIGRRPAMDPLGILVNAKQTWEEEGIGAAGTQLVTETVQSVPFVGGLLGGGRLPVSGALPDLGAIWDAATEEDWGAEKRWKELQDELNKLAYVIPPFGGAQVSKIWKAIDAYAKGGSYSVNNEGKEILQYAIYKDEEPIQAFGRLLKMAVMGKSAVESAQDWAEGGYKSLTAEETAIYQDMHDAGVKDRDAFELIQKVRQVQAPEGTGESEKAAVMKRMKKELIFGSGVSKAGQAIVYYGMTASETEKKWMNSLADAGADQAESLNFVVDLYDAGKLKGKDQRIRYAEVFGAAPLSEEEKQFAVQFILGTDRMNDKGNLTQYGKFLAAMETGLTVDRYMDIYSNEGNIDDFFKMHDSGVRTEAAADITLKLSKLEPLPGEEKVTWNQECDVILNSGLTNSDQVAALQAVSYESTGIKIRIGYENGLAPGALVYLKRILPEYDANGNGSYSQKEVTAAIDAVCGDDNILYALTGRTPHGFNLTKDQKAVLWQLQCNGKKNPYNQDVGDRIYQQWKAASTKDEEEQTEQGSSGGLTLQLGLQ